MFTPAEDPQVHGQGPGRASLSDSSGTEGEKSDSSQVFPDYSQLVPDRTVHVCVCSRVDRPNSQLGFAPISHIMSSKLRRVHLMKHERSLISGCPAGRVCSRHPSLGLEECAVTHCLPIAFVVSGSDDDVKALIARARHAGPHQRGALRPSLGTRRSCRAGPGRPLRSAQQALGSSRRRLRPRVGSWQHEPTWMSAQPARSTAAVDLTGRLRRIGNRTAHDRDSPAWRATERPHHARSVSMSRSTCMASARSDSSSASLSASARMAAPAFRRAASIRADRTTADTAVPSLVKTSSAFDVASSGRKVIVSAIATVYDVL